MDRSGLVEEMGSGNRSARWRCGDQTVAATEPQADVAAAGVAEDPDTRLAARPLEPLHVPACILVSMADAAETVVKAAREGREVEVVAPRLAFSVSTLRSPCRTYGSKAGPAAEEALVLPEAAEASARLEVLATSCRTIRRASVRTRGPEGPEDPAVTAVRVDPAVAVRAASRSVL